MGEHAVRFDPAVDLRFHREQMYPDAGRGDASERDAVYVRWMRVGRFCLSRCTTRWAADLFCRRRSWRRPMVGRRSAMCRIMFSSADELLKLGEARGLSIAEMVLANEVALLADPTIVRRIDRIVSPLRPGNKTTQVEASLTGEARVKAAIFTLWQAMSDCIERGIATEGTLPGGLNVRRRAPGLARRLAKMEADGKTRDPLAPLDSVTLVAMAVNEENAAGGRVVTAPTNGAAGVIPAIAYYYVHHAAKDVSDEEREAGLLRYFLTAAAIGILYKENASISGAEVGCQGEVGVACSMAAGGLVAALGGDNAAVEGAAEIAMEHNLGMTCDPIGGLVQIPCIERNGMGAVKAVNAARLAMNDQGVHKVSLDQVIETMYRTGMDMQSRYKETSLAGLALNIIEC